MEVLDEETKESDAGCSGEQRLTLLETFSHQVAGHGAIIKAKGAKICKPLVRRELWFYRDLARSGRTLLPAFIPRWFGCFHISKDSLLEVVRMTAAQREGEGEPLHNQQQHHEVVTWSEKVYHDLEHHLTAEPRGQVHHYIVLEDLTAVYRHPCLLDIKMGVRQWGDDATPKKIEYEKFKAETTTTCTLGLRVCGMKVFDAAQGAYTERNKEEGKKITKDNIVPYLASFFNNGRGVRAGALRGIKQKLEGLRTALRKEGALRLYSTSLLLLYEGDQPDQSETDADIRCDVRLIDFAHVYPLGEGVENDDGYMWGLDNLINLMEQI